MSSVIIYFSGCESFLSVLWVRFIHLFNHDYGYSYYDPHSCILNYLIFLINFLIFSIQFNMHQALGLCWYLYYTSMLIADSYLLSVRRSTQLEIIELLLKGCDSVERYMKKVNTWAICNIKKTALVVHSAYLWEPLLLSGNYRNQYCGNLQTYYLLSRHFPYVKLWFPWSWHHWSDNHNSGLAILLVSCWEDPLPSIFWPILWAGYTSRP